MQPLADVTQALPTPLLLAQAHQEVSAVSEDHPVHKNATAETAGAALRVVAALLCPQAKSTAPASAPPEAGQAQKAPPQGAKPAAAPVVKPSDPSLLLKIPAISTHCLHHLRFSKGTSWLLC